MSACKRRPWCRVGPCLQRLSLPRAPCTRQLINRQRPDPPAPLPLEVPCGLVAGAPYVPAPEAPIPVLLVLLPGLDAAVPLEVGVGEP